jgi:hypothetical protein
MKSGRSLAEWLDVLMMGRSALTPIAFVFRQCFIDERIRH